MTPTNVLEKTNSQPIILSISIRSLESIFKDYLILFAQTFSWVKGRADTLFPFDKKGIWSSVEYVLRRTLWSVLYHVFNTCRPSTLRRPTVRRKVCVLIQISLSSGIPPMGIFNLKWRAGSTPTHATATLAGALPPHAPGPSSVDDPIPRGNPTVFWF